MLSYVEQTVAPGNIIRIPQMERCVYCNKAYAESGPFCCGECRRHVESCGNAWNDMRLTILDDNSIPTNEPIVSERAL